MELILPMAVKFILDATANSRKIWLTKEQPNTIFMDIDESVKPDVVADYRNLREFADESFKLIIFDPPHLHNMNPNNPMKKSYGLLKKETWPMDIKLAANELWRVLAPYGVLIFKWNDRDISYRSVLKQFPEPPLVGHVVTELKRHDHTKKRSASYWFCFMKIPKTIMCFTSEKKESEKQ